MTSRSILFICFFYIIALSFTSCSSVTVKTDKNFELVKLPDNSEVYLNHNSSITYNESFDPRNIELKGEAFFIVEPGESPFVVSTSSGEVKVLGTEFNVKSDLKELEVEVEEGYVEMKTALNTEKLKREERAVYNTAKNDFQKGKAELKHKKWLQDLKVEFKQLGRDLGQGGKQAGKEFKNIGKDIKNDLK